MTTSSGTTTEPAPRGMFFRVARYIVFAEILGVLVLLFVVDRPWGDRLWIAAVCAVLLNFGFRSHAFDAEERRAHDLWAGGIVLASAIVLVMGVLLVLLFPSQPLDLP